MASKTKQIKKNINSRKVGTIIGSLIILFIVVVSFVVAPMLGDIAQTKMADIELGSYGDEKITFSFIKETPYRRELASLSNNSTDSMDFRVAQTAYNRTVTKVAAINEFDSNGYNISKEQLDDAVLKSGYYNVDGSFSAKVFKNTTETQKQELRNNVLRELKITNWINYTLFQQKRSTKYLEFLSSMSNKKRNFDYVTLEYSSYPDDLLLDYAKKDPKIFTELNLSRITVDNIATADEIVKKIENKEMGFSELATTYSTDNFSSKGGEMSSTTLAYDLENVFGITDISKVLNLKVNGTPLIIEKDGDVILLTLNKEIKEPAFEDLSVVKKYMLSFERGIIEDYFYDIINNNGDDLLTFGKEVKNTGLFSINYGGEQMLSTSIERVSQDPIFSRAVNNENFFTTLFKLNENTLSEPIVLGDTISIFKLTEEKEDETMSEPYVLQSLDRALVNYKSYVSDQLVLKSKKYTDNFFKGYLEILKINQGN